MNYNQWKLIYERIIVDLELDEQEDIHSAQFFNKLLQENPNTHLLNFVKPLIYDKDVVIFGAGPTLESSILKHYNVLENAALIAADGATSALIKYHLKPDIIVTDLDGCIPDQIDVNKKGSILIVHAHGDNINIIKKIIPCIKGPIIGTTQNDPSLFSLLSNIGGFTDGDRAIFLADHFQAKSILLMGFDCKDEIGKYSFSEKKDKKLKKKKLYWCEKLIKELNNSNIKFL